jgi:hypothetical protein
MVCSLHPNTGTPDDLGNLLHKVFHCCLSLVRNLFVPFSIVALPTSIGLQNDWNLLTIFADVELLIFVNQTVAFGTLALVYVALRISTRFALQSEDGHYYSTAKLTKDAVCGARSLVPAASLVADVYVYGR